MGYCFRHFGGLKVVWGIDGDGQVVGVCEKSTISGDGVGV